MRCRSLRLTLAPVVSLAVCAGCYGRNHTLLEGTYEFVADEVIRDECGIQSRSPALWSGTMLITGDLLRMQMDDRLYSMDAVGYFLLGVERFSMDGSAGNVTTQANGIECLVTLIQAHLDSTTDSEKVFHGTTQVRFRTDQVGCSCQLWARFTATLQ